NRSKYWRPADRASRPSVASVRGCPERMRCYVRSADRSCGWGRPARRRRRRPSRSDRDAWSRRIATRSPDGRLRNECRLRLRRGAARRFCCYQWSPANVYHRERGVGNRERGRLDKGTRRRGDKETRRQGEGEKEISCPLVPLSPCPLVPLSPCPLPLVSHS